MDLTRRTLLRASGAGLLASALDPLDALARHGLPQRGLGQEGGEAPGVPDFRAADARRPLLVVVFLRGGADALHLVPPVGDPGYAKMRGDLVVRGALPFAERFGLHPALAPLDRVVAANRLAAIQSVGLPHPTRSHFEAQDRMEAGDLTNSHWDEGWLARGVARTDDAFATLALTSALPLSLRGSGAFALRDPDDFGLPHLGARARSLLESQYATAGEGELAGAGRSALAALREFERLRGERGQVRKRRRGRPSGALLTESARHLVDLDAIGLPVAVACLESSGWDTHTRQGADEGQMARAIGDLGEALAILYDGLSGRREILVVVMTEFGRTVRPNGSGGTDHGHGGAMLLLGSRVRGGMYGEWRGLQDSNLYEGRDLPVTTDYRSVLWEVLAAHLGQSPPSETFPGFEPNPLGLIHGT